MHGSLEGGKMKSKFTFVSIPTLPAALARLKDVAYNLHWAWDQNAIALFRRLDSDLWETTQHNPVKMLGTVAQSQLEAAANDEGFLSHLRTVSEGLDAYLGEKATWFQRTQRERSPGTIAYFSAEFGISECLNIFAGGLGMLAGDHLKSSSDLGIPLVAIGLLYQQGYFRQYLNEAGWQQEAYPDNDFYAMPLVLERDANGTPLVIKVHYPGDIVTARIWRAQVGRVPLYLLDSNVPENRADYRDITDQLYGGDKETRIRQEVLLGIGGYRALKALQINPTVYHMNEGHSAFLSLERVRWLMETQNLSFAEASVAASAGLAFTTHTVVDAGHDYFDPDLVLRYLGEEAYQLGLNNKDFLALGRQNPNNDSELFCMTILAMKMASFTNGVSKLHAAVTRKVWQNMWPGVPREEVPVTHVTNGVHMCTWLSRDVGQLYERYLGLRWQTEPLDPATWKRVEQIPAEELWRTHERRRERLVAFTRQRLKAQLIRRGAPQWEVEAAGEALDPDGLTIGFARRFATYKRATLIMRDAERLAKLLNNPEQPVQIIFAGKAHPRDDPGKEFIRQIARLAGQEAFRRRVVFLENYDMSVARYLVQGCDVWLNNPLRPQEASGTSGMKAVLNGVLNLSTLDGWWDEAYQTEVGWAIGRGETYENQDYQMQVEAEALYGLLEKDIVPTFYERGLDGLPRRWIAKMKASIEGLAPFFNTHRMVAEYTRRVYLPASTQYQKLTADKFIRARRLAEWKKRVTDNWPRVRVEVEDALHNAQVRVGEKFNVRADVYLDPLFPEDVTVELCLGEVDGQGEMASAESILMQPQERDADGCTVYEARDVACGASGLHGYTVRVLPKHEDLLTPFVPGLITWA
jgi:glycogen phosphorylase